MKRTIIGIVAAVGLAASVGSAAATPSRGYSAQPLGSTTVHGLSIQAPGDSVALFVRAAIKPGGTTGWHSHPSYVFVLVRQGRVQVVNGDTCTRTTYNEGDVFVEMPGHVHKAVNNGDEKVVLLATFVGLPPDTPAGTDKPNPCRK